MTEKEMNRKIAAYRANETRKLAALSPRAKKARQAIQNEYALKIEAIKKMYNSSITTKISSSCKKSRKCSCETSKKSTVYEIYTRDHGKFVFLGKTTKNPLV